MKPGAVHGHRDSGGRSTEWEVPIHHSDRTWITVPAELSSVQGTEGFGGDASGSPATPALIT